MVWGEWQRQNFFFPSRFSFSFTFVASSALAQESKIHPYGKEHFLSFRVFAVRSACEGVRGGFCWWRLFETFWASERCSSPVGLTGSWISAATRCQWSPKWRTLLQWTHLLLGYFSLCTTTRTHWRIVCCCFFFFFTHFSCFPAQTSGTSLTHWRARCCTSYASRDGVTLMLFF